MDTGSRIAIVDYGMGNLHSVRKAFEACGGEAALARDPAEVARADALVVPGVGSFGDCVENLARAGLKDAIAACIGSGRPYLGICLGLQILFSSSEEAPGTPGLGIIPGKVRKFAGSLKVPHMGWNTIRLAGRGGGETAGAGCCPLFRGIEDGAYVYFVHSFYAETGPVDRLCSTAYILSFASVVRTGYAWGTQFHPEKSGAVGLRILENFCERC